MKNIFFIPFVLFPYFFINSCSPSIDKSTLKKIWEKSENDDSLYFSQTISDIKYYEGNFYISDSFNNRVVCVDTNFNKIKEFGKTGSGPREIKFSGTIYIYKDSLFVLDCNNSRINVYDIKTKCFYRSIPLFVEACGLTKFVIYDDKIFINKPTSDYIVSVYDLNGNFIYGFKKTINNNQHSNKYLMMGNILNYRDYIVYASHFFPVVIIFYKRGNVIKEIDTSEIDIINKRYKTINNYIDKYNSDKKRGVPLLFENSFIVNSNLFLMPITELNNSVSVKDLITINLNKLEVIDFKHYIFSDDLNTPIYYGTSAAFNKKIISHELIERKFVLFSF